MGVGMGVGKLRERQPGVESKDTYIHGQVGRQAGRHTDRHTGGGSVVCGNPLDQ